MHRTPLKAIAAFSAILAAVACATGTRGNTVPDNPPGLIGSIVPPGDTGLTPTDTTRAVTRTTVSQQKSPGDTVPSNPPGLIGSIVPPGDTGLTPTLTPAVGAAGPFAVSPISSDANIMALLHASNEAEIAAGQLAQHRSTNEAVRNFAQMMVADHSALNQQGTTLATQNSITLLLPDNNLPQLHTTESSALAASEPGSAFDKAYIAQQVAAHTRTLALIDASIGKAQNAALKTMLQNEVRPKVSAHLQRAVALQAQVGAN
jgi:putative membrane protein